MSTQSRKRQLRKDSKSVPADKVYDSEDLDNSDIDGGTERSSRQSIKSKKALQSPRKKRRLITDGEFELEDGQEVIGVVVQAPSKGLVPPGQVSRNTLDFLSNLKDPAHNNRTW